jgi:hypothetical protein
MNGSNTDQVLDPEETEGKGSEPPLEENEEFEENEAAEELGRVAPGPTFPKVTRVLKYQ